MAACRTRESCDSWKGLSQEIDRPSLDGRDGVADTSEPRHDDSRHRREKRQRLVQHIEPVRVRQAQVDDERVVRERMQALKPGRGIRRLRNREPAGLQTVGYRLPQRRFVFDEQNGESAVISHAS